MNFFTENKKKIALITAILLAICAFSTSVLGGKAGFIKDALGFIITPAQELVSLAANKAGDKISDIRNAKNMAEENAALTAKVAELETENKRLSVLDEENKKLSALLDIAQKYPQYETTGTEIISKDPGDWYSAFTINKGSEKGFSPNTVLTNAGGLVGKVTDAGFGFSKAISILDSRSAISAVSSRTGDLGVVKGDRTLLNDGLCIMQYIDAEAEIAEGDEIVTSHLSDIYPPGIAIGVVKEVKNDSNGLTKYAIIKPQADFKHLDTLLAIEYSKTAKTPE